MRLASNCAVPCVPACTGETFAGTYAWAEDRAQRETQKLFQSLWAHFICSVQTRAVALLSRVSVMCDDDTRLQRVVPYILVSSPPLLRNVVDELSGVCKQECSDVHCPIYCKCGAEGGFSLLQTVY